MTTPKAAEVFPPGEFLREELEARGWTVAEFAVLLGWPRWLVEAVLCGEKRINGRIAEDLGRVLGTSAALWLRLQVQWSAQQEGTHG